MRESTLVARLDEDGTEVLVVNRPMTFTLEETALAMHAVVDRQLRKLGARQVVGRSRVRDALREVAVQGWPEDFTADPDRVAYWRQWLVRNTIFSVDTDTDTDTDTDR